MRRKKTFLNQIADVDSGLGDEQGSIDILGQWYICFLKLANAKWGKG